MNKKRNTTYQKNIVSAALFALAMLVLVISCPLKRLLTNNYVSQSSTLPKSNQTSSNQYATILNSIHTNCCFAKNKISFFQDEKSHSQNIYIPTFCTIISNDTEHYFHSFLDGNKQNYKFAANAEQHVLPLFLQHRSLLI